MADTDRLCGAGFSDVADAHEANAARTAEALWASVDEIHADNAKRLGAPVDVLSSIPTNPRRNG